MEGFPKVVVQEAFPPCVIALYDAASKSRHLSHVGRFTLTSFLINIGMSPEALTELFKSFSDFNERLTRYQVEHIAGSRGSGHVTLRLIVRLCRRMAFASTAMIFAWALGIR